MPQEGKLKINGKDAYLTWGAYLTHGALANLMSPPPAKAYVSSASRLQNGKKTIRTDASGKALARIDARDVSLSFAISGRDEADLNAKLSSLISELMAVRTRLEVSSLPYTAFQLDYISCTQFSQLGGLGKFAIKFNEPDPSDRDIPKPIL